MKRDFVTATKRVSHYYADGTSGDDANDGLTALTPKKTQQAVYDIVPQQIAHDTCIHLSGTFTNESAELEKHILYDKMLVVDGGDALTQVAGPFTATGSSTSSLTVSGAGWTIDQYVGYFLEITSGALTGQIRTIQRHTADTITPIQNFSADPGLCTFQVVRPTTTVNNTTVYNSLVVKCSGGGSVSVQRFWLTGARSRIVVSEASCVVFLTGILVSAGTSGGFYISNCVTVNMYAWPYIVGTGWGDYVTLVMGCATLPTSNSPIIRSTKTFYVGGCVFKSAPDMRDCGLWGFLYGSRAYGLKYYDCRDMLTAAAAGGCIHNSAGYAPIVIDNALDVGVLVDNSTLSIGADVDVSNHGSHGIVVKGGKLTFSGVTTGSGNGGVGLYAHSGSQVQISGSAPPTVTGSNGDVAVTADDLETPMTWAEVIGAGGVSSAQEATIIKVS